MKLWKIMLAMLVAVLMISAVAMATETPAAHDHQWYNVSKVSTVPTGKSIDLGNGTQHMTPYKTIMGCSVEDCTATDIKDSYWVESHDKKVKGEETATTCTTTGYTKYTCSCGANWQENKTTHTGHRYTLAQQLKSAATCKSPAIYGTKCEVCGDFQAASLYPWGSADTANGHKWDAGVKQAPECNVQYGGTLYTCTLCEGEWLAEQYACDGEASWTPTKEATCKEEGLSTRACKKCGHVFETVVVAKNHRTVWHDAVVAKCNQPGVDGHYTCKDCDLIWTADWTVTTLKDITTPVNTTAHEILENGWHYEYVKSCTSTLNYKWANCIICGAYLEEKLPAREHKWADVAELSDKKVGVYDGIGVVTKRATCEENGEGYVVCELCTAQKFTTAIPAHGHEWSEWEYFSAATCITPMTARRVCAWNSKHVETKELLPANGHNWVLAEEPTKAPTCTETGLTDKKCTNCTLVEHNVVIPALGHDYEEKVTAATCTKDGKVVKTCKVCKDKVSEKIPAAHGATKEDIASKPACGVEGKINVICTVCDAVVGTKSIDALKHEYSWKATAPTPSANGKNEYVCALCGHVAETKVVKYTKMYYNNTITSFGPMTRELVGGNDWERVTPVDLTVDGVYTYDLIASNKYIVGKVTITVNAGTLTVSYKANGVDVKDEALLIYASKADLATGTAVTAPVGAAINAAETFGADSKVLVSLVLIGDYDAAGKGLVDASAAAGMIANID